MRSSEFEGFLQRSTSQYFELVFVEFCCQLFVLCTEEDTKLQFNMQPAEGEEGFKQVCTCSVFWEFLEGCKSCCCHVAVL